MTSTDALQRALELSKELREKCLKAARGEEVDRREIMARLVELRVWNRAAQGVVAGAKEATFTSRSAVESRQLSRQNLYYQHKHLRGEIERCEDFESRHENLDLVPESEFLESHPEAKELDEHQYILARLKDEEERRLELFVVKTRLQETRNRLAAEVKSLKEHLEDEKAFSVHMDRILDACEPLRKALAKH